MKKMRTTTFNRIFLAVLLPVFACAALAQKSKPLEVKEHKLSNGINVWLNEDHSQPKVFGAVVVNAGAKDCPNTGIAHYFEHIMFKGTEEIGTVDYAQEKPWLDSIAICYDRLAATTDEAERMAIQKDINRLSLKAGDYAIPNEFNTLISRYGGSGLNAGTSYDFTFYHNSFTPQFMEQWCWLNSDRLINPVFRLFQGELETVYEEKNMYSDEMTSVMTETIFKTLFGTQPYAYPVIGSTENLKNPRLSEMKKFYDQYYVGCNMGIVLCGDFSAAEVLPLLEKTFGRIPRGVEPVHPISTMPDILQERTVEVKIPVPVVSLEALAFKGVAEYDGDANALALAAKLLYNGKAGLLDSLVNEGTLMMSAFTPMSLNDAGTMFMFIVPNLLGKTEKAEAACLAQLKRIADGDFSDQRLVAQQQELQREALRELETIDGRALKMVMVMSSGHPWQDYLDKVDAIGRLTKADVAAAAQRWFNKPFVRFKKKYGNTEKDKISQPGYTPVNAKHKNAESAYAKRMAAMPVKNVEPRLIDFKRDAETRSLSPQAKLYTVKNPVNDLFTLTVSYNRGEMADPRLSAATALLNLIGTDSLTRQQLGEALQRQGADLSFESDESSVDITVTGSDANFPATMQLVGHFLDRAKPNDKSLKTVVDGLKADEKSLTEENTNVMTAMLERVVYGSQSPSLHRLTYKEARKLTGDELLTSFKAVFGSACDIVYSGTLAADDVERIVRQTLPVAQSQAPYVDYESDPMACDKPTVYVYDMPKARQTLVASYDQLPALPTLRDRVPAFLMNRYLGGGMSSVLFQEVREFRSMAYSVGSRIKTRSSKLHPNSPVAFYTITGTQGDKTMAVVSLVDSLLRDIPLVEKNFQGSRQECINNISNNYPSFRTIGNTIAALQHSGWEQDSNTGLADMYSRATMDDMKAYYEANVKNNAGRRAWVIVGSKKKLNLKQLQKYGQIVFLKEKDIFKK